MCGRVRQINGACPAWQECRAVGGLATVRGELAL